MLETKSKRLGAHTYKVTQLDAVRGRRALVRLGRVIGPAFAELQGKGGDEVAFGAAIAKLMDGLADSEVDFFCDLFAENTSVTGGTYGNNEPQLDGVFAMHFAGKYGEMIQWLVFCVTANFGSVFTEAASLLKDKAAASP